MTTDLGEYGSAEEPVLAPMAQPPHGSRLTRRHLVAIPLVLLLVEAVFLGERVHAQHSRDADPVRVATAFFTAVASDDAATAGALTRLPADTDTRFTPADLRAQGGISRPLVTGSTRHEDRATVRVTYTVAGLPAHSDLVLARSYDGFLHAPTWRIVGGLPVLHIRAAPFEKSASVGQRPVPLHQGAADVTVFPGVLTVEVSATPPAASAVQTLAATEDGSVVQIPATLDAAYQQQLIATITESVKAAGLLRFPLSGSSQLDATVGEDGRTVTFTGSLLLADYPTINTSATESPDLNVSFSGTATYGGGGLSLTDLRIG